jgi:hypothetical protein
VPNGTGHPSGLPIPVTAPNGSFLHLAYCRP